MSIKIGKIKGQNALVKSIVSELAEDKGAIQAVLGPNELVELVNNKAINVVFLELKANSYDPLNLCQKLTKINPTIPKIFFTQKNRESLIEKCFFAGATDVINNNSRLEGAVQRVRAHFESYESRINQTYIERLEMLINVFAQLGHEINNPVQMLQFHIERFSKDKKNY